MQIYYQRNKLWNSKKIHSFFQSTNVQPCAQHMTREETPVPRRHPFHPFGTKQSSKSILTDYFLHLVVIEYALTALKLMNTFINMPWMLITGGLGQLISSMVPLNASYNWINHRKYICIEVVVRDRLHCIRIDSYQYGNFRHKDRRISRLSLLIFIMWIPFLERQSIY